MRAEQEEILKQISACKDLAEFKASGLDLNMVVRIMLDEPGQVKVATKLVVKVFAEAFQATADVDGVSVSRYSQAAEMLAYAAACAPLLDSDRLARLVQEAAATKTAFRPLKNIEGYTSVLQRLLGGVTSERRLRVLSDLWRRAHQAYSWEPVPESWDRRTLYDQYWDGRILTLPEDAGSVEWWHSYSAKNFVVGLVRYAECKELNPAALVAALVELARDVSVTFIRDGKEVASQLVYALQLISGVEHSGETNRLLGEVDSIFIYSEVLAPYMEVMTLKKFYTVAAGSLPMVAVRGREEELRPHLGEVVQSKIQKSLPEYQAKAAMLLTSSQLEEHCLKVRTSAAHFYLGLPHLTDKARVHISELTLKRSHDISAEKVARAAENLGSETVDRFFKERRPYSTGNFLGGLSRLERRRVMAQNPGLEDDVLECLATQPGLDTEMLYDIVVSTRNEDTAYIFLSALSLGRDTPERTAFLRRLGEDNFLRLVKLHAKSGDYEAERLYDLTSTLVSAGFGEKLLKWAFKQDESALNAGSEVLQNLFAQGLVSAKVPGVRSHSDPDVAILAALHPSVAPKSRQTSKIEELLKKVMPALSNEAALLPVKPSTWGDYAALEGFKTFKYPAKVVSFDGAQLPGIDVPLRLVKDTAALKANADHMGNCTFGYKKAATKGSWALLQFTADGVDHNASVVITKSGKCKVGEINTRFNQGDVTPQVAKALKKLVAGRKA